MLQVRISLALAAMSGILAFAQPPGPPPHEGDFFDFHARMGMEKLVKGAPYSAQAVTQFTQTLADGSHIQRTNTASVARDSEGRTRREETIGAIGPLSTAGNARKTVFIHDPVAGASYVLDPATRTARQGPERPLPPNPRDASEAQPRMRHGDFAEHSAQIKTEDLGTQTMEGLTVQGKRITRTIPAGQIGNEHALQIVTETWHSPDLQATVMSKTDDPRVGETVYRLTSVTRAEPDASLFQVPADYKVTQDHGPRGHMPPPNQE